MKGVDSAGVVPGVRVLVFRVWGADGVQGSGFDIQTLR